MGLEHKPGRTLRQIMVIICSPLVCQKKIGPIDGYLKQNGVGVAVNFRSILDLSAYKNNHSHTPNADLWGRQTISLPFFENLTLNEQQYVVALINDWNSGD